MWEPAGFKLLNNYFVVESNAIGQGFGVDQAYFLTSNEISVQSFMWDTLNDTRLSGNPQILVDLTALKNNFNSLTY